MAEYRVRVALDVDYEDLVHGTQVIVHAPSKEVAAIMACTQAGPQIARELNLTSKELMEAVCFILDLEGTALKET